MGRTTRIVGKRARKIVVAVAAVAAAAKAIPTQTPQTTPTPTTRHRQRAHNGRTNWMGGTRLAGSVGPSSLPHETLPHEPNGGPFRTQFTSGRRCRRAPGALHSKCPRGAAGGGQAGGKIRWPRRRERGSNAARCRLSFSAVTTTSHNPVSVTHRRLQGPGPALACTLR